MKPTPSRKRESPTVPTEGLTLAAARPARRRQFEVYCPGIGVMHEPGQAAAAIAPPGPQGLLQGVQDQHGPHRGGGPPAQDPVGVRVDDERDSVEYGYAEVHRIPVG